MKVVMFNTHEYEKKVFIEEAKNFNHELVFLPTRLTKETASLAKDFPCICVFLNDTVDANALETISKGATKLIAVRSSGYNQVDLYACEKLKLRVVNVPGFSPNAIAEHAVALILSLNRQIVRSHNRVRDGNFSIEGLMGFDLSEKTVGIVGTGKVGTVMAKIMLGFDCEVIAHDLLRNPMLEGIGVQYVSLDKLLKSSDIISLHLQLTSKTHHLMDKAALEKTKPGVMIVNTARGGLLDTKELIQGLRSGKIGSAGLDVYEKEEGVFFADHSQEIIDDEMLTQLMTFPNVIITSHHAFLTKEAIRNIARTTMENIAAFESGKELLNEVFAED